MVDFNYRQEAESAWSNARRKAFWTKLSANLRGKDVTLLDYEEVCKRLNLHNAFYKGRQNVPLDKIVGSVGRYHDFIQEFLPVTNEMSNRWQHIAELYLNPHGSGLPPIECYKIGDSYFVKDGNHRVSVAKQLEAPDIEAYVWEYPVPITGLAANTNIDTLLIEYERYHFYDKTRLAQQAIELSAPGGYTELLLQIANFQDALIKIDETPISFEDAARDWYDMIYKTSEQIIEQQGILERFPNRTAGDVFVWVRRHQHELQQRYGKKVHLIDAAEKFGRQQQSRFKRLWEKFKAQRSS